MDRANGDRSNGYEALSAEFVRSRNPIIGAAAVRAWAEARPPAGAVLDLGCGHGIPVSQILAEAGLALHAIDASPAMLKRYRARFPSAIVACEPAEESDLFGRAFDGIIAWGLVFLLPAVSQRKLIHRAAGALHPGASLLFTAPEQEYAWMDRLTGRDSISLGRDGYRHALAKAGLTLVGEFDDEGDNHYFEAEKPSGQL